MDQTSTGPAPAAELAPQAPPAAPATSPADTTQSASSQAPQTPATAPSAELTALQTQLAAERQARQQAEQQARDHQAAFTQSRQQLAALVGTQPKADPMAEYVQRYTSQGFEADAAKVMAEIEYKNDVRYQTLQSSVQAQNAVPNILQSIYTQYPGLCANQAVVQVMDSALRQAAAAGRPDLVTLDYALNIGFQEDGRTRYAQQQPNQQTAPPTRPPNFNSMTGINTNFNGPAITPGQTNQVPAHIQAARDAEAALVRQNHNLPPKQP